jgi:tRNA A-37 threonylcarbamoyl transferase component Bud32
MAVAQSLLDVGPPPLEDLEPSRVTVLDASVLRPSRRRPVLRWTVAVQQRNSTSRPLRVIGKGYLEGGGRQAYELLGALRAGGLDGHHLQVPQPFGFDPVRQLLAQEEAPATTLHELIQDPDEALPAVARVGSWLARLHAVPVPLLPHLPPRFEQDALESYADRLALEIPAIAPRVRELITQTLGGLATHQSPLVVTHGDFQPKNVHLDDVRVMVIDFDRAALAPPARDLGHFVAQTLTMGASRHGALAALRPWTETFLQAYVAAGGSAAALDLTPVYVGRTFAEVLFYRLVVRPVPDRSFIPAWLAAWQESLDAVAEVAAP